MSQCDGLAFGKFDRPDDCTLSMNSASRRQCWREHAVQALSSRYLAVSVDARSFRVVEFCHDDSGALFGVSCTSHERRIAAIIQASGGVHCPRSASSTKRPIPARGGF